MSNNNHIGITLKTTIDSAKSRINSFNGSFRTLGRTTDKTNSSFGKFIRTQKKMNGSFQNMSKDVNRASTSIGGMGNKLMSLGGIVKGIGMGVLGGQIANAVQSNIEMIETIHLFEVAMGEFAETTDSALSNMSKLTGLDHTNLQNRVATYNLLARSMGMSAKNASVLSENTNRLANDLASLTNTSITQVSEDMRSGLIGQSRTMYKYGVDVTESAIKVEALNQGITKSVRLMTQGEKMALRYAVMIKQTGLSHGDFANTIETPANQLKILSERFATLTRSIGSLFIPMLTKILPYVNAVVIALTRIIDAMARLLGYKKPQGASKTSGGLGNIIDDADTATDNVGGTTDAIKKLKSALGGFDEINILGSKDTPKDDKGGTVDGGGSPFDTELGGYDSMLDQLKDKAGELADKIQPKLEFILKLVGLIGIGFMAWKLTSSILGIGTLLSPLGEIYKMITKIGLIPTLHFFPKEVAFMKMFGLIVIMMARFADLYQNSELFRKGLEAIGEIGKTVFGWLGDWLKNGIEGFGKMANKIVELLPESIKNFFEGFGKLIKGLEIDYKDFLITLAGIALLGTPFGVPLLIFEALTIAIRAIGYGAKDSLDELNFLADGVSQATVDKLEPFREKIGELDEALNTIYWGGMIIDETTMSEIETKLKAVTSLILSELDADQNDALKNLAPLRDALGKGAYDELILANTEYYTNMKKSVEDDEKKILEIMKTHRDENGRLTEEGHQKINEIRDTMNDVGIKHIAETEVEYNKIMNTLKTNAERISLEQASSIIKNSLDTKNNTIDNAETQYSTIELEAQRMLEVGAINDEQYKAIMASAEETRDDTIKKAEEQYENIHKATVDGLGKTGKFIDTETGEIKTKWTVWNENLTAKYDEFWENVSKTLNKWSKEIKRDWEKFGKDLSDLWESIWKGIGNFFIGIMNGVTSGFESTLNWAIDGLNKLAESYNKLVEGVPLIGDKLTINTVRKVSFGRIPKLARGGSLNAGQYFEAGEFGKAELVGNYSGQTTVMPLENSGFIHAMESAVVRGVTNAMKNSGGDSGTPIVVNVGGKTLVDTVVGGINRQSRISGKTIITV